ncbi:NAD-dependent epimerase/dehydratase family protein [Actinoplanes subtropicus]|uniref:NAD-dependent epimerase/dehydratase family protein n=1 Tax=Actinoplanes subtropicus TaxID=543632 RepID=UPI0004C2CC2B|nr:NAD-dependent epimerase/dehydratase family protein [Actinoplanes subtropicus]
MTSLGRRRVLVTGAGGFVGRHLVARLAEQGADVTALTRTGCDLTDPDAVRAAVVAARPEVMFHLAAARQAGDGADRTATATVNAVAGMWLVEAVPPGCRAVIRLGSSTEYAAQTSPMDELTPLRPRGYFGATKAAGSLLFTAVAAERGIRSCVLRAFQVYGPGDKPSRFVPAVLAAAHAGTTLALTGPGLRRDWVWVGDVVDACVRAAGRDDLAPGAVYNIGTGVQTANEELVATAERVTGQRIATRAGAHPGRGWDTSDWVCDPAAARADLDWKPRVDLAEGLARCWSDR